MPILRPNESVVATERAKYAGTLGTLFLTNIRLIFEHQSGLITKRTYVSLDMLLSDISTVSVEGRFKPKLVVISRSRAGRIEIEVRDPHEWVNKIQGSSFG